MKRIKRLKDNRTIYEHICDRKNIDGALRDVIRGHLSDPQVVEILACTDE